MRNGIQHVFSACLLTCAVIFSECIAFAQVDLRQPKIEYVDGEVIAKLYSANTMTLAHEKAALVGALAPLGVVSVSALKVDSRFVKMVYRGSRKISEFIRQVEQNPAVQYAEPNYIYKALPIDVQARTLRDVVHLQNSTPRRVPNDVDFSKNWGLYNKGQLFGNLGADIDATLAWISGTGSSQILVAIIDSGVDYNHPDLAANIWTNSREIPGNGIDDDGNGFVDDIHGYDFIKKVGDPMDDNNHGTHCAGTIGAVGDNGIGTAGVNWHVSMMALKFLSSSGNGSLEHSLEAIKYATKMHVHIMSNSWGGSSYSKALEDAIVEARDAGILFVAAAGNDGANNDGGASYPANYNVSNIISVAASDSRDNMARWSNYGAKSVHLTAPGVEIFSTRPNATYDTMSGTSMAAPHVAGAAALLWSLNRGWSFSQVKDRLIETVDPIKSFASKTISGGRLNINNAIHDITLPREAPFADSNKWRPVENNLESEHNYKNDTTTRVEVEYPGAKFMRVHFAKVSTEQNYDFVRVLDAKGEEFDALSGEVLGHTSNFIEGEKLIIELSADEINPGWGWSIDRVDYIM